MALTPGLMSPTQKQARYEAIKRRLLFLAVPPMFWLVACVLTFKICFPEGYNRYELVQRGHALLRLDRATGLVDRWSGESWKPLWDHD